MIEYNYAPQEEQGIRNPHPTSMQLEMENNVGCGGKGGLCPNWLIADG